MSGMENKYWISRHRYLELKHFCLQYPLWIKNYLLLTNGVTIKSLDPTSERAIAIAEYRRVIALVYNTAMECGGKEILDIVTTGKKNTKRETGIQKFYYLLSVRKGL